MASHRRRLIVATALATCALLAAGGAAVGYVVLENGWYNVAATRQHVQLVHTVLEKGMRESVRFHARDIAAPPLGDSARVPRGARLYKQHCQQCHGGPGVAQEALGKSMQPVPGPLADAARRWQPRELYWITRHGIKMAGMPAWEFHLREDELWDVTAFLWRLPTLTAAQYRTAVAGTGAATGTAIAAAHAPLPPPDIERGRTAMTQYACNACHKIPGVTGPDTYVGPPLTDLARRKYLAGVLPNSADNLARWIRDPLAVDPQTTMPMLGVSERDARDMAAYLLEEK